MAAARAFRFPIPPFPFLRLVGRVPSPCPRPRGKGEGEGGGDRG